MSDDKTTEHEQDNLDEGKPALVDDKARLAMAAIDKRDDFAVIGFVNERCTSAEAKTTRLTKLKKEEAELRAARDADFEMARQLLAHKHVSAEARAFGSKRLIRSRPTPPAIQARRKG